MWRESQDHKRFWLIKTVDERHPALCSGYGRDFRRWWWIMKVLGMQVCKNGSCGEAIKRQKMVDQDG